MKLFVWDLHGVLEKGNDGAVLEITNRTLNEFGYSKRMTKEESEHLSGKRWHEYFEFLLPEASHSEHVALQANCFYISNNEPDIIARYIKLNDHADFVLKNIAESPFCQILISNSPPKSLDIFTKILNIEHYFPTTHRFGADSHTQHKITKKDCLNQFLEGKQFPEGIISIGDSPGDMTLIEHLPKTIKYLYAHPNRRHRDVLANYKIQDLREVLREINVLASNNLG